MSNADALLAEANEERGKKSCCGGNRPHIERSAELYEEAAKSFKISGRHKEAGCAWKEYALALAVLEESKLDQFEGWASAGSSFELVAEAEGWSDSNTVKEMIEMLTQAHLVIDPARKMRTAELLEKLGQVSLKYAPMLAHDHGQKGIQQLEDAVAYYKEAANIRKQEGQNVKLSLIHI
eukprot:TRINITY_DN27500_c0_g1_i5.p2 TRINITY_DN27500_c0_g1~~TRINITY_DN27500_c0_g1_i5.p2  ORF type:complete len:179 (-),score=67.92 TRINITY_DN27500_c0_g1_i5:130-666(-)